MYTFILLNTIPCYYRLFEHKETAENFGFALQRLGETQKEKYRYKIFKKAPKFIENKRVNGYELVEMDNSLYRNIIEELRNANFERF